MPGVVTTKVGFTGGTTKNVTYRTLYVSLYPVHRVGHYLTYIINSHVQ